jgi:hypothetical protein
MIHRSHDPLIPWQKITWLLLHSPSHMTWWLISELSVTWPSDLSVTWPTQGTPLGYISYLNPQLIRSALTDLQVASLTPASATSFSRVSLQPDSPAHRFSLPRLLPESIATVTLVWVPSLCAVRADYKLARQFPPELFNTGTELEQQRSMPRRSQISHWSRSVLSTG